MQILLFIKHGAEDLNEQSADLLVKYMLTVTIPQSARNFLVLINKFWGLRLFSSWLSPSSALSYCDNTIRT